MEDEINVRDYGLLIIKNWWILTGMFFIGIVAALIYSFVVPSVYEAETKLLILSRNNKVDINVGQITSLEAAVDVATSPTEYSWLSVDTLLGLATAGDLTSEIIDSLDLRNKSGELLAVEQLSEMLNPTIDSSADSPSLINMSVRGSDATLTASVANTWAQLFQSKNAQFFGDEIAQSYDFIDKLYVENKAELDLLSDERKQYIRGEPVEVLTIEIEQQKLDLQQQLEGLEWAENSYIVDQDALLAVERLLEDEPEFLVISKAIDDLALWQMIALDPDVSTLDEIRKLGLKTEVLNPIYQQLKMQMVSLYVDIEANISKYELLSKKVIDTRDRINHLNSDLLVHQLVIDQYDNQIANMQKSSDTFWNHRLEVDLSIQQGASSIRIVENAVIPTSRVSPNRVQNVFVGGVLGLICGVVVTLIVGLFRSQQKQG